MSNLRILSLGAGVQSTCLFLLAREGVIHSFNHVIFADTGAEPASVYENLRYLQGLAEEQRLPLHIVSAGDIGADVLESASERLVNVRNPPFFSEGIKSDVGRLRRKCTSHYKVLPILRRIREILGVRPRCRVPKGVMVDQMLGISMDEVTRMKPPRDRHLRNVYPLIGLWATTERSGELVQSEFRRMRRSECLDWMRSAGYPTPPRSACTFCPYRSDREWRTLAEQDPDAFASAAALDTAIRTGIGGSKNQLFVHRSLTPLSEKPFAQDDRQLSLWDEECDGLCGV